MCQNKLFMINQSVLSSQACYHSVNKSDVYVHVVAENALIKKMKIFFKNIC